MGAEDIFQLQDDAFQIGIGQQNASSIPPPPEGSIPLSPGFAVMQLPGGGPMVVYQYVPGTQTTLGGWQPTNKTYEGDTSGGLGGGVADHYASDLSYDLGLKELDLNTDRYLEEVRANKATEAETARSRGLTAASAAISAYLRASENASARRLSAFQESRALLPFLVNKDQKYFSGQEEGGILDTAAKRFGLPFTPTEIQHKTLIPATIAQAPTDENIGTSILGEIDKFKTMGQQGVPV